MSRNTTSKNPLRQLLNLCLALAALYSLIISVMLLTRKRLTENFKVIAYFNSFAQMSMLPTLILLPINLLLRPWLVWFQVIPVASFIASYGRLFVSRPAPAVADASSTLKVMTFNIQGAKQSLDQITEILCTSDADIISIQELSYAAAEHFKIVLGEKYPHQAVYTAQRASRGQGVLSRYPITAETYWRNDHIALEALGHLRVEIDFGGTPITLYNTHPLHPGIADDGFDTLPRGVEIDMVLEKAANDTGAVLLMGDFNMTDQNEDYQRITARYGDSFREVGSGMGFTFPDLSGFESLPSYWPLPVRPVLFLRLDYVFHDKAFRTMSARVWPTSGGSDHRPVWVELALINKENE